MSFKLRGGRTCVSILRSSILRPQLGREASSFLRKCSQTSVRTCIAAHARARPRVQDACGGPAGGASAPLTSHSRQLRSIRLSVHGMLSDAPVTKVAHHRRLVIRPAKRHSQVLLHFKLEPMRPGRLLSCNKYTRALETLCAAQGCTFEGYCRTSLSLFESHDSLDSGLSRRPGDARSCTVRTG